jgi:FAD/FMN-containing dehydrogenase
MEINLSKWGPITVLVVIAASVYLVAGAAVVVFGDGMTFQEWGDQLWKLAAALGLTGVGRGLALGGHVATGGAGPRSARAGETSEDKRSAGV